MLPPPFLIDHKFRLQFVNAALDSSFNITGHQLVFVFLIEIANLGIAEVDAQNGKCGHGD